MRELGKLEANMDAFHDRRVRVVVVSDDDLTDAVKNQEDFPNLIVVSDHDRAMAKAFGVLHEGANPNTGGDTNAPTTFLVDTTGTVRWLYRPEKFVIRLTPGQLLDAVNITWPGNAWWWQ